MQHANSPQQLWTDRNGFTTLYAAIVLKGAMKISVSFLAMAQCCYHHTQSSHDIWSPSYTCPTTQNSAALNQMAAVFTMLRTAKDLIAQGEHSQPATMRTDSTTLSQERPANTPKVHVSQQVNINLAHKQMASLPQLH